MILKVYLPGRMKLCLGRKGCRRIKWTSGNPLYRRKRDSAATAGERGRK